MRISNIILPIIVIFNFLPLKLAAQRKIVPLVNIGFNHFIGEGISPARNDSGSDFWSYLPPFDLMANGLWAQELHIGGGINILNRYDILLYVRSIESKASFSDYGVYYDLRPRSIHPSPPYRSLVLSLAPTYRLLKGDFSPLIGIEAGTEIYSNARGKFMSSHMILLPELKPGVESVYNSGLFFGKAKLMFEYRYKNLRFQSGASYNYYQFSFTKAWLTDKYVTVLYVAPSDQYATGGKYTTYHHGLGIEFNIVYTLGHGKKGG